MEVPSWLVPTAALAISAAMFGLNLRQAKRSADGDYVRGLEYRLERAEATILRLTEDERKCQEERVRLLERICELTRGTADKLPDAQQKAK